MRRYDLTVNDKTFSILVRSFAADRAEMEINGTLYNVHVDSVLTEGEPRGRLMRSLDRAPAPAPAAPRATASPTGGGSLLAPIPGQILEVFVKEGDEVTLGQPVLKMEAMKMENVINAHVAGVVGAVRVNAGDAVSQGQELIVIG